MVCKNKFGVIITHIARETCANHLPEPHKLEERQVELNTPKIEMNENIQIDVADVQTI